MLDSGLYYIFVFSILMFVNISFVPWEDVMLLIIGLIGFVDL